LQDKVRPTKAFYPVSYEGVPALMQPNSSIDQAIGNESYGIHIWRSQLTARGRANMPDPPPDSALAKLCTREGIEI